METTQEVEIFFNFIGRYVPPRFGELNLTPEEQEALRKKEETKDSLHRNYIRRRDSGKQKKYEEIAKGVFVPLSHLPKKEPKKPTCRWRRTNNSEADISFLNYPLLCDFY